MEQKENYDCTRINKRMGTTRIMLLVPWSFTMVAHGATSVVMVSQIEKQKLPAVNSDTLKKVRKDNFEKPSFLRLV